MIVLRTRVFAAVAVALFAAVAWFLRGSAADLSAWWNGETGRLSRLVWSCLFWSSVGAAGISLTGLVTAPAWARGWPALQPARPSSHAPRWFIVGLIALTAVGACVRVPRLGLSLYNDEAYVFRRHIGGMVPIRESGNPSAFREPAWLDTLYDNRQGNNSPVFSVLARTAHLIHRAASGAGAAVIHEPSLRIPVLFCGSLAIAATGWLAFRIGGPPAGITAALLTAFHPWHVRYSVEARCYGILLLLLPVLWLALHRALSRGTWRAWAFFGLLELLTVSCFFGAVFFLVALHLALVGIAIRPAMRGAARLRDAVGTLVPAVVCGVAAVAAYLLLHLPLFVQLVKLTQAPAYLRGSITPGWLADAAAYLSFGFPGASIDPPDPQYLSLASVLGHHPWAGAVAIGVAFFVLCRGVVVLTRMGGTAVTIPFAALGGLALAVGYCLSKGVTLLPWYSIFALPGVLVILATGMLPARLPARRAWIPVLTLLPFAALWAMILPVYLSRSREDLRGAIAVAHGDRYPAWLQAEARPLIGSFWSESPVYDAAAVPVATVPALDALIDRARREKRELFVESGFPGEAAATMPDLVQAVLDPDRFALAGVKPGLDSPDSTHAIYRLLPAPGGRRVRKSD